jgi:hypothetical protein
VVAHNAELINQREIAFSATGSARFATLPAMRTINSSVDDPRTGLVLLSRSIRADFRTAHRHFVLVDGIPVGPPSRALSPFFRADIELKIAINGSSFPDKLQGACRRSCPHPHKQSGQSPISGSS